jgi:hypothetical protein
MMWDVERGHEIPTRDMIHDDVKQADYGTDYHNQSQNLQISMHNTLIKDIWISQLQRRS